MFRQLTIRSALSLLVTAAAANVFAQSSTDLFDVTQTTITVSGHTPTIGGSNDNNPLADAIYNIFGGANANVEGADRALFSDASGTAFINFTRSSNGTLNTLTLYEASDGGTEDADRGVNNFSLFADGDGNGTYEAILLLNADPLDNGSANTYAIPSNNFTSFRAEFTPPTGAGSRVLELDATFNPLLTDRVYVDRYLLNATTNTGGDEPAGRSFNFLASSSVGGIDTPEDVFGNTDGTIEGDTFLFGDGGNADNGDSIMGNGDETVYTLAWSLSSPTQLHGLELLFGGGEDGPGGNRGTQLYEIYFDGNLVASGDANGVNIGKVLFAGGPLVGDELELRITGTVGGGSSGPRIVEINALVPEPATALLAGLGGVAFIQVIRRRRR